MSAPINGLETRAQRRALARALRTVKRMVLAKEHAAHLWPGICYAVAQYMPRDANAYNLLRWLWKDWPEHSGCASYPIRDYSDNAFYGGAGAARMRLIDYALSELRERGL